MAVNVRVELRLGRGNNSPVDRDRAFKMLLKEFNNRVNETGILHAIKEREFYQSKSEKRRKKRHESALRIQQEKILDAIERGESPKGASKFLKKKKKSRRD